MNIDLANASFGLLMSIGFVNVLTFFKPDMNSQFKFFLTIIFAFALTYVPADLQSDLLNRAKVAIELALAGSGTYKVAQKIGGS